MNLLPGVPPHLTGGLVPRDLPPPEPGPWARRYRAARRLTVLVTVVLYAGLALTVLAGWAEMPEPGERWALGEGE